MSAQLALLTPLWLVAGGAILVLLLTVAPEKGTSSHGARHLVTLGLLIPLAALAALLLNHEPTPLFSGAVVVDALTVVFGGACLLGTTLAVSLAYPYLREHELAVGEYIAIVLLCAAGMLMLVMSVNLMVLFIGLEAMSLAAYVLAGYRRAVRRTQEAALKYFVYGAFASAFILMGIALIFGEVGALTGSPSIQLDEVGQAFRGRSLSVVGVLGVGMLLAGLCFKVAVFPFHMWAPDVYEGAPTPSSGFLAVGIKTAAFGAMLRVVWHLFLSGDVTPSESLIRGFEIIAVLTMFGGNLLAIRQRQVKRMLAYSSVAHAGYVMVGVVAFLANPGDFDAAAGIAYYLIGYAAMTLGAFGVVLAFERQGDRRLDWSVDRMAGAGLKYPALGLVMAVFMLALAGIPPTAGFAGKVLLFTPAVQAGRTALVVAAVLASAMGAYYYLRVLVVMFMRSPDEAESRIYSPWLSAGLLACAALTLVVGLSPDTWFEPLAALLKPFS